MGNVLSLTQKTENNSDLFGLLKLLEEECRHCVPITPLECIQRCKVYKIKNELRRLRETMDNPNYIKDLCNVLKNETRFTIMQAIANSRCSVSKLQMKLKKTGHRHSQDTVSQEFLRPLMAVGLVTEAVDEYYLTEFGGRLAKLLECFPDFSQKLPAHSECHEETILRSMLSGPKTSEDVESLISPKIASRILKRLRLVGLIETPVARDYVFFFKSKRDPNKETFTVTQRKIYNSIVDEGISAGRLAKITGLSLRRTYTYLRGLRGKKLVYLKRTPKTYCLTSKGEKLASMLQKLQQIVEDTWESSEQVMQNTVLTIKAGGSSNALSC
jgi:DNA-binding HxlR family transcriptional regulator